MRTSVANPTERRVAQRFRTLSDVTALVRELSHSQIVFDMPALLSGRLVAPRYRARLERRFLRRTGVAEAPGELLESMAPRLVPLGDTGLRDVIVDTGIMCQYAILRRIVDQATLAGMSTQLGSALVAHDARCATRGASIDAARAIASPGPAIGEGIDAITTAILRDGLQCWTCWVHTQPASLRRFFHALTPSVPDTGTDIAARGCRPRDCRHRAGLFDIRLDHALTDRAETGREEA